VFVIWFLAGGAIEVLNTLGRMWSVERLGADGPRSGYARVTVGFFLRLAGTGLVLAFAFRYGVVSGIGALVGYWLARWAMVWWVNRRFRSKSASPGQS
jgi:hypothetical protein